MWAVIPVKNLADAKQRLSAVLAPQERRSLFLAMLRDVLRAIAGAKGLAGCLMVTRDPVAIGLAREISARILVETANEGQSAAVRRAGQLLVEEGAEGLLTVPGDVPLLAAADIELALSTVRSAPAVTIVPSRDRRGSNCLVARPADAIPFHFGPDSFAKHLAAARERGLAIHCVEILGFSLDIDEPEDLMALPARLPPGCTRDYLVSSGVLTRLERRGPARDPGPSRIRL